MLFLAFFKKSSFAWLGRGIITKKVSNINATTVFCFIPGPNNIIDPFFGKYKISLEPWEGL